MAAPMFLRIKRSMGARQTIELTFEPFFHWTTNFKTSKIFKFLKFSKNVKILKLKKQILKFKISKKKNSKISKKF